MFRDGENVLQRVQMKVRLPKIMGCIILMMKTLVWWHRLIKGLFSRPFAILHAFEPMRKQNHTKDMEGLGQSRLFFDPQPWPVYIAWEVRR